MLNSEQLLKKFARIYSCKYCDCTISSKMCIYLDNNDEHLCDKVINDIDFYLHFTGLFED